MSSEPSSQDKYIITKSQTKADGLEIDTDESVPNQRTNSTLGAFFNIVCIMAGMGTLGLPKIIAQSGWAGVGFIIAMALVAFYTGGLLIDCLYYVPDCRLSNYPEVGQAAFGTPGMRIVQAFHYADMLGAACLFIMLIGINGQLIGQFFGYEREIGFWIALSGVLVLIPYAGLKFMRQVSFMAFFGALDTATTIFTAVLLGALQPPSYTPKHDSINWDRIPIALASISFTFGGNVVYPHVEASMRNPKQWRPMLASSLAIVALMYLIISIVCYKVYGSEAKAPIMLSLPPGLPNLSITILITLQVISATPIILCSFSLELESMFNLSKLTHSPMKEVFFRLISRSLIVALLTIIASGIPYFAAFMSLIDALANSMMVFILPIICHLQLFGIHSRPIWEPPLMLAIVSIAVISSVLGSISAISEINSKFKN